MNVFYEKSNSDKRAVSFANNRSYLDKIEKENLIDGVSKRWNDKFVLNVKGYSLKYCDYLSIYQTQYSIIFPYHINGVGVVPIWYKSASRIKQIFEEKISASKYTTTKRDKLGHNILKGI